LTEFLYDSGLFASHVNAEIREKILSLRDNSNMRRNDLFESGQTSAASGDSGEPVVSFAELNGLLGGV
jgi:hypothetical protein